VIGVVALVAFIYVPCYTFGEDIKMLKDAALTFIPVFSIIVAFWAASKSLAEEIEGRTALTVLSKPIGRLQFIVGKFVGIVWAVALMFIILGTVLLIVVAYKPIYDEYESGGAVTATRAPGETATWEECHQEMVRTVPGLILGFMEAVVLASISVAFSTRLPMLANILTCVMIYVLGHLTPLMVQSSLNRFEPVTFVARLIATVFPVLDHFNIQAAVAGGAAVPLEYLGWSGLYCILYSTIAMLLALLWFEDRDLA
jgi:ABC-type transport system involved in multi-copper enzyme maturation permease subunit